MNIHSGIQSMKSFVKFLVAMSVLARLSLYEVSSTHFSIMDLDAVNGWEVKSTQAIRKTIEAASEADGNTVYIPADHFLTGPIHLKSNITLYVEGGAHVKFRTDFVEYFPMVPSRFEGVEVVSFSPLMHAKDANNISIRSRGILEGQGKAWWAFLEEINQCTGSYTYV